MAVSEVVKDHSKKKNSLLFWEFTSAARDEETVKGTHACSWT